LATGTIDGRKGYHPNIQENHLFVALYSLVIETIIKTFIYLFIGHRNNYKTYIYWSIETIFKKYIFIGHRQ
jgi:hypothetical protein